MVKILMTLQKVIPAWITFMENILCSRTFIKTFLFLVPELTISYYFFLLCLLIKQVYTLGNTNTHYSVIKCD